MMPLKRDKIVEKVIGNDFDSSLEVPSSGDPNHNAMLAITLRYRLIFADSKNRIPHVIVQRDGISKAVDGNNFAHDISDWDATSRSDFTKALWRSEKIWNMKFMLVPPLDFSDLDFQHPHPGWSVRPNVMCLFRMEPWGDPQPHIRITVVRATDSAMVQFISHTKPFPPRDMVLDYLDPGRSALGHELGHVLGMPHIKALKGDKPCITLAHQNDLRCYGETDEEIFNIMGRDRDLLPLNAKPWLNRIALHTGTRTSAWQATLTMKTAPQIIGTGRTLLDI